MLAVLFAPGRDEVVIAAIQAEVDRYWNEAEHG